MHVCFFLKKTRWLITRTQSTKRGFSKGTVQMKTMVKRIMKLVRALVVRHTMVQVQVPHNKLLQLYPQLDGISKVHGVLGTPFRPVPYEIPDPNPPPPMERFLGPI